MHSMNELTPAERGTLRARAHHLQPVVMIGDAGLTPQVMREIEANLKSHELIKIRVLGDDRHARDALPSAICEATDANAVQQIGKMLVIYRPRPPEEKKKVPQAPPGPQSAAQDEAQLSERVNVKRTQSCAQHVFTLRFTIYRSRLARCISRPESRIRARRPAPELRRRRPRICRSARARSAS